jgi:hypothetical protein
MNSCTLQMVVVKRSVLWTSRTIYTCHLILGCQGFMSDAVVQLVWFLVMIETFGCPVS